MRTWPVFTETVTYSSGNSPGGVVLVGTVTLGIPTKWHPCMYHVTTHNNMTFLQAIRVQAATPVDEQKL